MAIDDGGGAVGLGWIRNVDGADAVWHNGGTAGFAAGSTQLVAAA